MAREFDVRPADVSFGDEELKMIPRWSMALAIVVFIGMQWVFHGHTLSPLAHPEGPGHQHHQFLPMRIIMSYVWGTALASYVLMLGYVSRDAKRRGMSTRLWMLVSVVLPGGLGAVVYFLLRQPIATRCPNCSTSISSSCHFCPQCQFQLSPACGVCHRSVKITDVYCTQCGHDLADDHAPSRLRVYSDN
jgi:hypothetical protein